MGSYKEAEICELVGIITLTRSSDCDLYRDNGLVILQNKNG